MFKSSVRHRTSAMLVSSLLLLAAACGGSSNDDLPATDGVASLGDASGAPSDDGSPTNEAAADPLEAPDNPEDAFALFNECMEEHGIAGGVTVFAGGDAEGGAVEIEPMEIEEVDPQTAGGSLEDFDADMYDEANKACEGHLANIDAGFDMTPEQQAAFDDAQLEFADCMAEHGIDVPEPASSGGGIVVSAATEEGDPQSGVGSPDDLDFDFEAFDEAAKDCDSAFAQLESIQP